MIITRGKIKKIVSFLIVTSPILNIYRLGRLPICIGEFGLCLSIVLYLLFKRSNKIRLSEKKSFLIYFLVFLLVTLISMLIQNKGINLLEFLSKWSKIIVFCIVLDLVVGETFDYNYACKLCVNLTVIVSISVLIQESFKLVGLIIMPYFDLLPLNYGMQKSELIALCGRRNVLGIWRVSGIFPEPAHFAQYVLLGLAITLFKYKKSMREERRDYISAIVITFALIVSASAIGYFLCILLWIIWAFNYLKDRLTAGKFVTFMLFVLVGFFFFFKSGALENAMYRLNTIGSFSEGSTGGTRLLQGLYVFKQLNFVEKIIGIGFGNLSNYLIRNSITTPFLSEIGNEYMNAFSTVLVSGGGICFSIFIFMWIGLVKACKHNTAKMIMLIITILFCSADVFYSCTPVFYLAFVISSNKFEKTVKAQNL